LNENTDSLFIRPVLRSHVRELYLPLLLILSAYIFRKNVSDDTDVCEPGDIITDKNRIPYTVTERDRESITLVNKDDPSDIQRYYSRSDMARALQDELTNQCMDHFDNFIKDASITTYPKDVASCAVVICEKKTLYEELDALDSMMKRAFPLTWVSSSGADIDTCDHLQQKPMIYAMSDFATFKKHIMGSVPGVDSVIFLGKNTFANYMTDIGRHLRMKNVPRALFIGATNINVLPSCMKWTWTCAEMNILHNKPVHEIIPVTITSSRFQRRIADLKNYIESLEKTYTLDLKQISYFLTTVYSLIIPSQNECYYQTIHELKKEFQRRIQRTVKSQASKNQNSEEEITALLTELDEICERRIKPSFDISKNRQIVKNEIHRLHDIIDSLMGLFLNISDKARNVLDRLDHLTEGSLNVRFEDRAASIKEILLSKTADILKDRLIAISVDPASVIKVFCGMIESIFAELPAVKCQSLQHQSGIDTLIVPSGLVSSWRTLISSQHYFNNNAIDVMSFREFMNKQHHMKPGRVFLLSLFGYSMKFYEIVPLLLSTQHSIHLLVYPEEKELLEEVINQHEFVSIEQCRSDDREKLCGVLCPVALPRQPLGKRLEYLYERDAFTTTFIEDLTDHVFKEIIYDNGDIETLDVVKKVILDNPGTKPVTIDVIDIKTGDHIRVYEQPDRSMLMNIIIEEDDHGRMEKIMEHSRKWKQCLADYYKKNKKKGSEDHDFLLQELQKHELTVSSRTLTRWLDEEDDNLFPLSDNSLTVIKDLVQDTAFDESFDEVIRSKTFYRSILISAGRTLSSELCEYVLSGRTIKGELLARFRNKKIDELIERSAPLRKIKGVKIMQRQYDE
jgi:hypothetical protein